jgi:hypothetical protein
MSNDLANSIQISHKFNAPFSMVTSAFWKKFPNKYSQHVKTVDVLDRRISNNTLQTTRLFHVQVEPETNTPWTKYVPSIFSVPLYSIEYTTVDPTTRSLYGINRNISLSSIFECKETFKYTAESPDTTTYTHSIHIVVHIPIIGSYISKYLLEQAKEKSEQGISVIENLL